MVSKISNQKGEPNGSNNNNTLFTSAEVAKLVKLYGNPSEDWTSKRGSIISMVTTLDHCFAVDDCSVMGRSTAYQNAKDNPTRWNGGTVKDFLNGDAELMASFVAPIKRESNSKQRVLHGQVTRKVKSANIAHYIAGTMKLDWNGFLKFFSGLNYDQKLEWFGKFSDIEFLPGTSDSAPRVNYYSRTAVQQSWIDQNHRTGSFNSPSIKECRDAQMDNIPMSLYDQRFGAGGIWNSGKSIAEWKGMDFVNSYVSPAIKEKAKVDKHSNAITVLAEAEKAVVKAREEVKSSSS